MDDASERFGKKRIRIATVLGGAAVLIHFLWGYLLPVVRQGAPRAASVDEDNYFMFLSFVFFVCFPLIMLAAWFTAYRFLLLTAGACRLIFARKIPWSEWRTSTLQALWPLPYAAAMGAILYDVYYLGGFGGWPDDLLVGIVAHALGAWCYLTICWYWYRLVKACARMRPPVQGRG